MEEAQKIMLAKAVLSGLLKWDQRRVQEYDQFPGTQEEKDALRAERRLETMFLLRRGLHVGYYQIVTRALARDRRWDDQRADLIREAVQTLVTPTGTFEPEHHAKATDPTSRRSGAPRHQQKRYHDHFPEFFFEVGRRADDRRFKILSTVFSPLDVPGFAPRHSPFFVMDPRRVATIRFVWTAETVPGTVDFAEDLLAFRTLMEQTFSEIRKEGGVDEDRFRLMHGWLTKHGMISLAFRAQVAAITSVQWFRRQSPSRRRELIGIPCPRDDAALAPDRLVEAYSELGLPTKQVDGIVKTAKRAAREADTWEVRSEKAAAEGLAQLRERSKKDRRG